MRLLNLHIDRYLMLRDLTLRFDRPGRLKMGSYALDFLVGLNGSGKSTLLRALAQIVADLHANRPTDFNYRLEYELPRGESERLRVQVVRQKPHLSMSVYNADTGDSVLDGGAVDAAFLPARVVVYTTGNLNRWDELEAQLSSQPEERSASAEVLADPIARSIAELPGHLNATDEEIVGDDVQSPLLILREDRLPIMALTGLLTSLKDDDPPLAEVLQSLDIRSLRGFSLRLRLHQALSDDDLFNKLRVQALRHVQQGSDHLLVFAVPEEQAEQQQFVSNLWSDYATPLDFYDALDRLCEPLATGEPTLQQVDIFLERELVVDEEDGATRLLLFDWMSDGERSFLGRMAMLAMLQTKDSLILLDEPEVHFNDYWKREIVKLIDRVMHDHANHLLIVSHSSIGLSDVADAQVTIMRRGNDGFAVTYDPMMKTFGADPSEIMSVVFRTELSIGAYAAQLLSSAVESGERQELAAYLDRVGPGMWMFRLKRRLEDFDAAPAESA